MHLAGITTMTLATAFLTTDPYSVAPDSTQYYCCSFSWPITINREVFINTIADQLPKT